MTAKMRTSTPTGISEESFVCSSTIPCHLLASSRDLDWKSLLLDHRELTNLEDVYETKPTPDQSIVVMIKGRLEMESCNGGVWQRRSYSAGTVGLTPGGKIDRLRRRPLNSSAYAQTLTVFIPQATLATVREEFSRSRCLLPQECLNALALTNAGLVQAVSAVFQAVKMGAPELYAETAAQWLSMQLLQARNSSLDISLPDRNPGVLTDRRLERVLEYISANLSNQLSLDELANEAAVSKYHFVRLFRRRTGLTPHAFLIRARLDEGKNLLLTTNLNVTEVATRCGYLSSAHFSTAFSSRFGVTPSEIKNNYLV